MVEMGLNITFQRRQRPLKSSATLMRHGTESGSQWTWFSINYETFPFYKMAQRHHH